jgi:flavin-binding protein dodecin
VGGGGSRCRRDGREVRASLRIAEVLRQDVTIQDGRVTGFRVRLGISFKYETDD